MLPSDRGSRPVKTPPDNENGNGAPPRATEGAAITRTDVSLAVPASAMNDDGPAAMARFETFFEHRPGHPGDEAVHHRPMVLHRLAEDGHVSEGGTRPDNDT